MRCFYLLFIFEFIWPLRSVLSFTSTAPPSTTTPSNGKSCRQQQYQPLQLRSLHRSIMKSTQLYAVKMVYKWRVLPSGSLTGICDDGIITTSALQEPASATPNAIVTTASGSQYKLMGDPIGSKNSFATISPPPSSDVDEADTASTTISIVALVVISGIFAAVVLEKLGFVGSPSLSIDLEDVSSINNLSGRTVALILYSIGITIATIQLINDANKLSKS